MSLQSVKRVVESTETKAGRAFDAAIQGLIVLSLVSSAIETLPNLPPATRQVLGILEIAVVAIFTAEYALRIIVADHPLRFIVSFFGLVDLIAILPFYLASGIDLRAVRVLRLLRLFRTVKLLRYGDAVARLRSAFLLVKQELVVFFAASILVLYVAAVGIYYFERDAQPEAFASVFHGLWWAVATLTTVGYGDVYPITVGGRLFTFVVLMIGLGVVAVPTGLLASGLSETRRQEQEDRP